MQKREEIGIEKHIMRVFRFLALLLFVIFCVGQTILPREVEGPTEECKMLQIRWQKIMENGEKVPIEIKDIHEYKEEDRIIVEGVLPKDLDNHTWICMRTSKYDLNVYVNGSLREQYSAHSMDKYSGSSVSVYLFIPVSKNDANKVITVEILNSAVNDDGYIGDIYYGEKTSIWLKLFSLCWIQLQGGLVLAVVGVGIIMVCAAVDVIHEEKLGLQYLGWLVFMMAVWMLLQCDVRQIVLSNITLAAVVSFVIIMLVPIPCALYCNDIQGGRYHTWYYAVCNISLANFIIQMCGKFINNREFSKMAILSFAVILFLYVIVAFTIYLDYKSGKLHEYIHVAIGFGFVGFAAFLQIFLFERNRSAMNGALLCIGMTGMVVMAALKAYRDIQKINLESQKALAEKHSQEQFLAQMSHEIRTPLNAILGMNEIILNMEKDETVRTYAKDIQNAGQNLLLLINDILDFSKIQSGKMEIIPVKYRLLDVISECSGMILNRVKEKGLRFETVTGCILPTYLYGDEVRIRQIVLNLLTNAVKYTNEGKITLLIDGHILDDNKYMLKITIADTGIGIKPQDFEKLYDSFKRVNLEKTRTVEGSGLGLAIVKQLCDLMGGTVSADSKYGKGSYFTVEIPQDFVKDTEVEIKKNRNKEEKTGLSYIAPELSVLVVDDVEMNLKVVKGLLKSTQIQLDVALSGAECLDKIKSKHYHMIFLDHMMPKMDGIQTLYAMKEILNHPNEDTPVIMLTANAIEGAKEDYLEKGFVGYLSKPITGDKIKDMILKFAPEDLIIWRDNEESV